VLISAANGGNVETVELLLQRICEFGPDCGDSLESTDEGGYTPLLLAAQRGHLEVVKLLAAYGANIHARTTRHDNDAIALAMDYPEVQAYLQAIWAWRPLQIVIDARMVDRVHALVQNGACLDDVPVGTPPLLQLSRTQSDYPAAKPPVKEIELLLRQARQPWAPCRHALFPTKFRADVRNLMMLKFLLGRDTTGRYPILPPEIWLHIATCMQRNWYVSDADAAERGWVEPTPRAMRLRWRQRRLLHVEPDDCDFDDMDMAPEEEDEALSTEMRRARNSTSAMSDAHLALAAQFEYERLDGHVTPIVEMMGDDDRDRDVLSHVASSVLGSSDDHSMSVCGDDATDDERDERDDEDEDDDVILDELGSTAGTDSSSHWSKECEVDLQEVACRVAWV
jgi:hypothetical protein